MAESWHRIELTEERRRMPQPDAVFQIRHEFLHRYAIYPTIRQGAMLLANFELDHPEQILPANLYYYLSPGAVGLVSDLLHQWGAQPYADPSMRDLHFIAGDKEHFSSLVDHDSNSHAQEVP